MGITGLLPLLKSIHSHTHISSYANRTLAIDAYCWLHRGAYACAEQLAKGEKTVRYVDFVMHRIRLLRHNGVKPYVVMDGGPLRAKKGTEEERKRKRDQNLADAHRFAALGNAKAARDCFTKCVDVTPEMAFQLIKALKAEGVPYVVAPFEADAQLAYLCQSGIVDGVITEDSDLIVFGCELVLYKLDSDGNCMEIDLKKIANVREYNFTDWTLQQFRQMAILSGCDYLESIKGIGLSKAYHLVRKYKTIEKILQFVRLEGKHSVPKSYLLDFQTAELVFQHQRIYCPVRSKVVPLNPLPENFPSTAMDFIGQPIADDTAQSLAAGDICPTTFKILEDINPQYCPSKKTTAIKPGTSSTPTIPNTARNGKRVLEPVRGTPSIALFFPKAQLHKPTTPSTVKASGGKRKLSDETANIKSERSPKRKSIAKVLSIQSPSTEFDATATKPRVLNVFDDDDFIVISSDPTTPSRKQSGHTADAVTSPILSEHSSNGTPVSSPLAARDVSIGKSTMEVSSRFFKNSTSQVSSSSSPLSPIRGQQAKRPALKSKNSEPLRSETSKVANSENVIASGWMQKYLNPEVYPNHDQIRQPSLRQNLQRTVRSATFKKTSEMIGSISATGSTPVSASASLPTLSLSDYAYKPPNH